MTKWSLNSQVAWHTLPVRIDHVERTEPTKRIYNAVSTDTLYPSSTLSIHITSRRPNQSRWIWIRDHVIKFQRFKPRGLVTKVHIILFRECNKIISIRNKCSFNIVKTNSCFVFFVSKCKNAYSFYWRQCLTIV